MSEQNQPIIQVKDLHVSIKIDEGTLTPVRGVSFEIRPGEISGIVTVPPSKSVAHRAIICAAISNGISKISNIYDSEDILATLDCVKNLGADIKKTENSVIIKGITSKKSDVTLPCRESGSTLRFLIPLSLVLSEKAVFTGSPRLIERGIGVYEEILTAAKTDKKSDSITVTGNIFPSYYKVSGNISSQFITGLLLALPLLDKKSNVEIIPPIESRPYIDISINVLKKFG